MDYNKLKTFTIVAETASISRTAELLRRTQPAVTIQIQNLEKELGITLLERKKNELFLTGEGTRILKHLTAGFKTIEHGIFEVQGEYESVVGNLSLGVNSDFGNYFLVPKLEKFCSKYPNINISVKFASSEHLERLMLKGELDLGLFANFRFSDRFIKTPISEQTHQLVASPEFLSKFPKVKSYENIIHTRIIDYANHYPLVGSWVKKNCLQHLATLRKKEPFLIAENLTAIKNLVVSGAGVSVLPNYLTEHEVSCGKLVEIKPRSKPVVATFYLVSRKKSSQRMVETVFSEFLLNHAK